MHVHEDAIGNEQCYDRPAIIVSNNIGNAHANIVEIVYLTSRSKANLPTHVHINSSPRHSIALCEQISTISKDRLGDYLGCCSQIEMDYINNALMISLALK